MLFFQSVLFLGYLEMGDARLALESEPPQQFDLLVMDGFSGDSAPVHLVTREAFRNYFRHLKPGGIVAVNFCNSYLNLRPVMAAAAALGRCFTNSLRMTTILFVSPVPGFC